MQRSTNQPIICTVANNEYFHYIENMLVSIAINAKGCLVYIELINIPEKKINSLYSIYENIELKINYIDFPSIEIERGYCTNRRAYVLYDLLDRDVPLLYLDADTIINKNINTCTDMIAEHDLLSMLDTDHITYKLNDRKLSKRPKGPLGTPYYGVFSAGIIAINNSEASKNLVKEFYTLVKTSPYLWYTDQEALFLAYSEFKEGIKFKNLYQTLASQDDLDSVFVFSKGTIKEGIYRELSLTFKWKHFGWKQTSSIEFDKLPKLENERISLVKLAYKMIRQIICNKGADMNQLFNMSYFKNETIFTLLRRLDWEINKRYLKRRYIKRSLDRFSMYLDTTIPGISKTLAVHGTREQDMIYLMDKYLKPGSKVLDCGSNIGFYPLLEAEIVGHEGAIISVEPDLRNYDLLNKNMSQIKNKLPVYVFNVAISNVNGESDLLVTKESNLNKIVRPDNDGEDYKNIQKVKTITVDSLLQELDVSVDFVRMDIEGHEVEVLQGMANTLKSAKKGFKILFELHPNEYTEHHSLEKELRKLFSEGFYCKAIVSAGCEQPNKYIRLGYKPDVVIATDGLRRGVYYNINNDDAITLAIAKPKASRYILLDKK